MRIIIYNGDKGHPVVVVPTPEALHKEPISVIARRDVPYGKKFKILDASGLPDAPQESWEVDDADLTDGIGERQ